MNDAQAVLGRWQLNVNDVRERMYRAPTARERERWHAVWLVAHGWSVSQVAVALGRDTRTIGNWLEDLRQSGPTALAFEQSGGPPPP
jgi:transposase